MNKDKTIEVIRKRNAELNKQIAELNNKISMQKEILESSENKSIDNLLDDFNSSIKKIHEYEEKYNVLINDLRECLKNMKVMGFKIPWYRKLFYKLKHK